MYAVGQVKMVGSEMRQGDVSLHAKGNCEVGGFVLWQKNPDLWYLELVVSGFKVGAGSDGKVAWNQSSSQPSHASKGPPRPLRRFFQVYIFIAFKLELAIMDHLSNEIYLNVSMCIYILIYVFQIVE